LKTVKSQMSANSMKDDLQALLDRAVENRVASGIALGVAGHLDEAPLQISLYAGTCAQFRPDVPVNQQTIFDLASLTKPLVTALSVAGLVEKGVLAMESTLSELLQGYPMRPETARIQVWQLLAHCSGLPAHRPYYVRLLSVEKKKRWDWVLASILSEPHQYRTGTTHLYSDLGYMLLGKIVEIWTRKTLDSYFRAAIADPLGVSEELFFMAAAQQDKGRSYTCTEVCPWNHSWLCGVVHDDNCRVLGAVGGHAGLFGSLSGVMSLCSSLQGIWAGERDSPVISRQMLKKLMTRVEGTSWCYGFDSPATQGSSAGRYFSSMSVGHLGFTGTSFWMDLKRGISIALLTNRVHPSRKNERLKPFRPFIHDAVMQRLLALDSRTA